MFSPCFLFSRGPASSTGHTLTTKAQPTALGIPNRRTQSGTGERKSLFVGLWLLTKWALCCPPTGWSHRKTARTWLGSVSPQRLTLAAGEGKAPLCSHQAARFNRILRARSGSNLIPTISHGGPPSLRCQAVFLTYLQVRKLWRVGCLRVTPGLGGDPRYQFNAVPVLREAGSLHWAAPFAASSHAALAFSLRANQGMSGNDCDQPHYPRAQPGRKHSVLLFYE